MEKKMKKLIFFTFIFLLMPLFIHAYPFAPESNPSYHNTIHQLLLRRIEILEAQNVCEEEEEQFLIQCLWEGNDPYDCLFEGCFLKHLCLNDEVGIYISIDECLDLMPNQFA